MAAKNTNKQPTHFGETIAGSGYASTTAAISFDSNGVPLSPISPHPRALMVNGTGTLVTMDRDGDVQFWQLAGTGSNIVPFQTNFLPGGTQTAADLTTAATTYSTIFLLF